MADIFDLFGGVDARDHLEHFGATVFLGAYLEALALLESARHPLNRIDLAPGEAERLAIFAGEEFEREHAHAHEIASMDALEAFGYHGPHSEERRAFCRPIARGAGSVLLACDDYQRNAVLTVLLRRLEDRCLPAIGEMNGEAAFYSGHHLVAQPDIGERSTHHHFVIAAARAVGVEIGGLDAVRDQILPGRSVGAEGTRRRDMVGRHTVSEHREDAGALEVGEAAGLGADSVEERRRLHVFGFLIPTEPLAARHIQRAPSLVAVEDVSVLAAEHL